MENWHYLINQIDNVTKESNILGIRISNTHDGKLFGNISDPFIAGIYETYHPVHVTYIKAMAVHGAKIKLQKEATDIFTSLITKLGFEDINNIDSALQMVYNITTPKYKSLLGTGHAPYQHGTQEERIAALNALKTAMETDVALTAVTSMVDHIYTALTTADTNQKGAISAVEIASKTLEIARKDMSDEQFGDLGLMIHEYRKDPSKATPYYDLQALRNFNQTFFQRHVNKSASKFIVERTVEATAQATFNNIGVTTLRFYIATSKTGIIGATYLEVLASETKTVFINTLGDITALHFFMVENMDAINKGEFTLEFL